ncbi:MAG: type II toxin-antitoxin system VapC family toxin [Opitutales bacterium]|nr:type II toxin-antitoxin system VapC family toxin [Opitutales bacterium]
MNSPGLFWDACALVPLLIKEVHSEEVQKVWRETGDAYAWEWVLVEVEACLIRRKASPEIWRDWRKMQRKLRLFALQPEDTGSLRLMNRSLGLRAADAGHLFIFNSLIHVFQDLQLISFDQEMVQAAQRLGLPIHSACIHA